MEDSGIDSDSKPAANGRTCPILPEDFGAENKDKDADSYKSDMDLESTGLMQESSVPEVVYHGVNLGNKAPTYVAKCSPRLMPTSLLQKRLEKQILKTRKMREQEQTLEGIPKKLIPRSRLKVPRGHQAPVVTKTDSHPLVSWESDSEDDLEYHPISKSAAKEITEQLIKDGYNLDLTPDDEDLDLIPPKPLTHRCVCCSLSCTCLIQ